MFSKLIFEKKTVKDIFANLKKWFGSVENKNLTENFISKRSKNSNLWAKVKKASRLNMTQVY